eukprot:9658631-Prorocentrum_lima.AAC.1
MRVAVLGRPLLPLRLALAVSGRRGGVELCVRVCAVVAEIAPVAELCVCACAGGLVVADRGVV